MNINTNKICKNCAHNDVCKFKDEFNITLKSAYKELTKIIKNYDHLSIKIDCKHRYMINSGFGGFGSSFNNVDINELENIFDD